MAFPRRPEECHKPLDNPSDPPSYFEASNQEQGVINPPAYGANGTVPRSSDKKNRRVLRLILAMIAFLMLLFIIEATLNIEVKR